MPTNVRVGSGQGPTSPAYAMIRKMAIFASGLTNANLQTITA